MKSVSSKTDQDTPDQSKSSTLSFKKLYNQMNNDQMNKQTDKPMDKESINLLNSNFFRPNLFNLIGLVICFSFYSQIDQLENRIQHLEMHCQPNLHNDKFEKQIELNSLLDLKQKQSIDQKETTDLPLKILKFVDQVSSKTIIKYVFSLKFI